MLGKIRFLRNICVPQHIFFVQFQFKNSFNNENGDEDDKKIETAMVTEQPCSINQFFLSFLLALTRDSLKLTSSSEENELIGKLKQKSDEDLTFYGKTVNKENKSEQQEDLKSFIRDSCPTKAEKLREDYYFYQKDKEAKQGLRASKIEENENHV